MDEKKPIFTSKLNAKSQKLLISHLSNLIEKNEALELKNIQQTHESDYNFSIMTQTKKQENFVKSLMETNAQIQQKIENKSRIIKKETEEFHKTLNDLSMEMQKDDIENRAEINKLNNKLAELIGKKNETNKDVCDSSFKLYNEFCDKSEFGENGLRHAEDTVKDAKNLSSLTNAHVELYDRAIPRTLRVIENRDSEFEPTFTELAITDNEDDLIDNVSITTVQEVNEKTFQHNPTSLPQHIQQQHIITHIMHQMPAPQGSQVGHLFLYPVGPQQRPVYYFPQVNMSQMQPQPPNIHHVQPQVQHQTQMQPQKQGGPRKKITSSS